VDRFGTAGRGSAKVGLAAAVAAAIAGAVVWALLTIATDYKLGLVAVGIGLLVGKAVELLGGGDARLPVPAAVIALLGCLVGDLLTDAHFASQAAQLPLSDVLGRMLASPALTKEIYAAGFAPLDLLFYAIAAYEGYKFARVGVMRAQALARPVSQDPAWPAREPG
jgi:TRAP-type uncharacterized transport system fused permease subunit